jgi:hypothetical protein
MANLTIEFNEFGPGILTLIKDYLQANDEDVRKNSASILESVVFRTTSLAVLTQLLDVIVPIVDAGSSNWYARYGIVKSLAAVGKCPALRDAAAAEKEKLAQKALPALQKALEKESNKDCFQVLLSAIATWTHCAPNLMSEKMAQLFIKGTSDKGAFCSIITLVLSSALLLTDLCKSIYQTWVFRTCSTCGCPCAMRPPSSRVVSPSPPP